MATVTLHEIKKNYGDQTVLDHLSLTLNHGECFTLLGPSGCGKSVLLRLIAGFETPDAGSIHIGDLAVTDVARGVDVPSNQRGLGVVFQEYAVWPHMTVFNNIAYPLKLRKLPLETIKKEVMAAVALVNLTGMEQRFPSQLSGGQQQRVALARALVAKPPLMLLDEPLCNLDANLREEMRFEINALQKSLDITILYVTHDQEIGLAISDRLAIMDEQGRIRQIGTPEEIFESPVDDYVFRFMGVANFIQVERIEDRVYLQGVPLETKTVPEQEGIWMLGCRPFDIDLDRKKGSIEGCVKRVSFLGATMDYLIDVQGTEIRVVEDTHAAMKKGPLLQAGAQCFINFDKVLWFPPIEENHNIREERL